VDPANKSSLVLSSTSTSTFNQVPSKTYGGVVAGQGREAGYKAGRITGQQRGVLETDKKSSKQDTGKCNRARMQQSTTWKVVSRQSESTPFYPFDFL